MSAALIILSILGALLVTWGLSLQLRGLRRRGGKRSCPSCFKPIPSGLACSTCGYEGSSERDLKAPRDWRLISAGLLPIIAGAAAFYAARIVYGWFYSDFGDQSSLGPAASAAIGISIFALALAIWSHRGDRSRGRRRCPRCWYDMTGSALTCPECGHDARAIKNLYRPRRRKKGYFAAIVLLLVSYGVWVTPRVRVGGPVAAIPTWFLIVGLPYLPDWMILDNSASREVDWTLHGRMDEDHLWAVEKWVLQKRARFAAIRGTDVWSLARVGPFLFDEPRLVVPVNLSIIRGLASPNSAVRLRAVTAAESVSMRIGPLPKDQVLPYLHGLLAALDDSSTDVRSTAASYLSALGDEAGAAVPKMIEGLDAPRKGQMYFVIPLRSMIKHSALALELVIRASADPSPDVRRGCAIVLSGTDLTGWSSTERLLQMLHDPDEEVAREAAESLCRAAVHPDIVIPAVLEWIEEEPERPRLPYNLDRFGTHLRHCVPRIARCLDERASRWDALSLIERLADQVPESLGPAIPRIASLAFSDDQEIAEKATAILDQLARCLTQPGGGQVE